jgi:hypothetical protein
MTRKARDEALLKGDRLCQRFEGHESSWDCFMTLHILGKASLEQVIDFFNEACAPAASLLYLLPPRLRSIPRFEDEVRIEPKIGRGEFPRSACYWHSDCFRFIDG